MLPSPAQIFIDFVASHFGLYAILLDFVFISDNNTKIIVEQFRFKYFPIATGSHFKIVATY